MFLYKYTYIPTQTHTHAHRHALEHEDGSHGAQDGAWGCADGSWDRTGQCQHLRASGFGKFRVQGLADHGIRFLRLPLKVLFLSKTYLDGHGT